LCWIAIGVFVIEREFLKASAFALAGAMLTFFGFMHGPAVGFAVTPGVATAYAIIAVVLFAMGRATLTLPADGQAMPVPAE